MISLPPKGSVAKKLGSNFAPLRVDAQALPNMTVQVAEGGFWTAENEHMEYIGGTSPTIAAPTSDAKWVLVTVKDTGLLNIIDGIASGSPELPSPATYKDELPLAAIFVGDTTTAITDDMVYDLRPLWSIPPDSVSQAQLNDFATITYVDNGLVLKADVTGTPNADFFLNVGGSSINDSGFYVDRFSGPDVGIRFNEAASPTPLWEFTNDGATWNPIGVSTGNYYLKTELDNGALDIRYYTQNDLSTSGVLDSRYYEKTAADAAFAPVAHMHVPADITGLANPVETINLLTPVAGDVQLALNDLNDVLNAGPTERHVLVYNTSTNEYQNSFLNTDDLADVDTTSNGLQVGQVLSYTGAAFVNKFIQLTDISDFDGNDYVQTGGLTGLTAIPQNVFGVKTFKDGIVVETSLTLTGNNTTLDTKVLNVTDPFFDINTNESLDGVGGPSNPGTSGFRVFRGPNTGSFPAVTLHWDEAATQWELSDANGITEPILTPSKLLAQLSYTQINDFSAGVLLELGNNTLDAMSDVAYLSTPSTGDHLIYGVNAWENMSFATNVTTELTNNNLSTLADVVYTGLAPSDFLRFNGNDWENKVLVKLDVTDFVESDYIHVTGNESKVGDLALTGDLSIDGDLFIGGANVAVGSITTINSETLNIKDNRVTLNFGEAGAGASGGTAGFDIDRGTESTVSLWWSELGKTWVAHHDDGVGGITFDSISFNGHQHLLADITDLSVSAGEVNALTGILVDSGTGVNSPVRDQIINRISRQGDTMDVNASLSFSGTGEVIGLPAIPLSVSSATSKAYVDGIFNPHIADLAVHLTPDQNTFLDGLTLPTLTSGDVNQLININGNVQTLLDAKTDKVIPAVVGNLATLDAVGNLLDSGLILNDVGTSAFDLWSADKINTTKIDKVLGTTGNVATWDGGGDLLDSGVSVASLAPTIHSHIVADITDFSTAFTTQLGVNNLQALGDVTNNAPTSGDILQWNGTIWDDVALTSLSTFVKASGDIDELVTGEKTFQDDTFFQQSVSVSLDLTVNRDLNVVGDLVVQGDQIVQGSEVLAGNTITMNYGSAGAISAHAGGLILERFPGTIPGSPVTAADNQAVILWDETSEQRWKAGIFNSGVGTTSINNIALEQVTVAQPLYNIQTGTGNAAYTIDFNGVAVPAPEFGFTAIQIFVNGVKQIEGGAQAYTVDYLDPLNIVITFNAADIPSGPAPGPAAAVEFYGFGYIS